MVVDAAPASREVPAQAEAEASTPGPLVRRARADRRTGKAAELPAHAGKERRAKTDRRKPVDKKPDPSLA
jgi:hypothetical protein